MIRRGDPWLYLYDDYLLGLGTMLDTARVYNMQTENTAPEFTKGWRDATHNDGDRL